MFVPSLSWQNDHFLYKMAQKDALSYRRLDLLAVLSVVPPLAHAAQNPTTERSGTALPTAAVTKRLVEHGHAGVNIVLADQRGRAGRGEEVLRHASLGAAERPDLAVGPGLGGEPLADVVAVLSERVVALVVAFAAVGAAERHEAHREPLSCHALALRRAAGVAAISGVALREEHRVRAAAGGAREEAAEARPVSHRDHERLEDHFAVLRQSALRGLGDVVVTLSLTLSLVVAAAAEKAGQPGQDSGGGGGSRRGGIAGIVNWHEVGLQACDAVHWQARELITG